jgi:hypothetical protein
MLKYIMVDIEADGPAPGEDLYSMLSLGAVVVDECVLDEDKSKVQKFYAEFKPISKNYDINALNAIGMTREQTLTFPDPKIGIMAFVDWLDSLTTPVHNERFIDDTYLKFIADTAGFDWMFTCTYLWKYAGRNPFGFSAQNMSDLFRGRVGGLDNCSVRDFRRYRITKHTHNALDDAMGNAEAMVQALKNYPIRGVVV